MQRISLTEVRRETEAKVERTGNQHVKLLKSLVQILDGAFEPDPNDEERLRELKAVGCLDIRPYLLPDTDDAENEREPSSRRSGERRRQATETRGMLKELLEVC